MKTSNKVYKTLLLYWDEYRKIYGVVLGSQGVVVKCTTATFFDIVNFYPYEAEVCGHRIF